MKDESVLPECMEFSRKMVAARKKDNHGKVVSKENKDMCETEIMLCGLRLQVTMIKKTTSAKNAHVQKISNSTPLNK